jgi:hypothetical protein
MQYKMLLEELLKHTPESENGKLVAALASVSVSATHCKNHIAQAMRIATANALHERFAVSD